MLIRFESIYSAAWDRRRKEAEARGAELKKPHLPSEPFSFKRLFGFRAFFL